MEPVLVIPPQLMGKSPSLIWKAVDKSKIPHRPGVYIYKNLRGEILYVGKAIDLYHRIASYFKSTPDNPKTAALVSKIASLETIEVLSELEALILEANLIKKYLPPFNVKLTDDKDYLYIKITNEDFPRILTARKNELLDAKEYFGPFPSSRVVKVTLKKLRRIFPWCANPKGLRPCFYYHIHQCPGPCAGKVNQKEYIKIIKLFSKFMEGKKEELVKSLIEEMEEAATHLDFEKAQTVKRTLGGVEYLTQINNTEVYFENPNFLEDQNKKALEELKEMLTLLKTPSRIECFDISNTLGREAVGSMVVLTDGDIDKKWYRKFKVKIFGKPNDVGMMKEVVGRRLKHPEWPFPDLILVDGGRAQVRAAVSELDNLGLNIPIYGLAKRLEWLYAKDLRIVKLPKSSLALRMLQKIRDEAHRFAISYHRKLRSDNFLK